MLPVSDEEADLVVKKLQAALDVAMDTGIVIAKEYEPWLKARKDQIDFYYWDRYVLYLEEDLQRPSSIVSKIDEVSDRIVDLAGDPTAKCGLKRRGLVIGDVQSGKTANYIAVMNKAADVGFKVIILLGYRGLPAGRCAENRQVLPGGPDCLPGQYRHRPLGLSGPRGHRPVLGPGG